MRRRIALPKHFVQNKSENSCPNFVILSSFVIRASSFPLVHVVQFLVQPCSGKSPVAPNRDT
jgi:hypothetical protein